MCIDYTSIAFNILSYTEYCLFLEKVRKEETKRREMFEYEKEKQIEQMKGIQLTTENIYKVM